MESVTARADAPNAGAPVFTRQATGLVRGVRPWTAAILNFVPGHPAQSLAIGFFFVFALFPGGNYLIGLALVIPMVLAVAYSFGLLTTMVPRSGGDYMLVSRVLHPLAGLISSFCMTTANLLSLAFFGLAFTKIGLSPGLVGIGIIGRDQTLINWGTELASSTTAQFIIGSLMLVVPVAIHASGWSSTRRVLNGMFWVVSGGLLIAVLVAIFTSQHSFASAFNHVANHYTGKSNSYHAVISGAVGAGINVNPSFSFTNTLPVAGLFAIFSIFSYFSTFVGGELREASSIKTAHNMAIAGVTAVVVAGICAAIFFHSFGSEFLIAANGSGLPGTLGGTSAAFWFLSGASIGNAIYAAVMVICFLVYWPLVGYVAFLQPQRHLFAYAFDGVLPKVVTKVTRRGSPWVALLITFVLTEATFIWAVTSSKSFFEVIVYATLVQLIATLLVGLAAVVVPYLRPQFYRASATHRKVAGVPVVSIAGFFAMVTVVIIWFMYFHYKAFGLANAGKFFTFFGAVLGAAILYYLGARVIRRHEGVDIALAYSEIPPE